MARMIIARALVVGASSLLLSALAPSLRAQAQSRPEKQESSKKEPSQKERDKKGQDKNKSKKEQEKKGQDKKRDEKSAGKPSQIASFGDWGVYATQAGKAKTCYALAKPQSRLPAGLKRSEGYAFISTRPAEGVRNEIAIAMGFPIKEGAAANASAEIGPASFPLIAKGEHAWVKNPAEEAQMLETMRKGAKLVVKAASLKNAVTTDAYSLSGFAQAIDRVAKECP